MFFVHLGSIGMGFVWGWLIASLEGRVRLPWQTIPAVILATLTLDVSVFWFADWQGLLFFLSASLLACLIHVGWRRELRARIR